MPMIPFSPDECADLVAALDGEADRLEATLYRFVQLRILIPDSEAATRAAQVVMRNRDLAVRIQRAVAPDTLPHSLPTSGP